MHRSRSVRTSRDCIHEICEACCVYPDGLFGPSSLRSVTESGPYFHDGRAKSLDDAVDFMLKGGIPNPHLDEKLKTKMISKDERGQLMAFLKSLTAEQKFDKPQMP